MSQAIIVVPCYNEALTVRRPRSSRNSPVRTVTSGSCSSTTAVRIGPWRCSRTSAAGTATASRSATSRRTSGRPRLSARGCAARLAGRARLRGLLGRRPCDSPGCHPYLPCAPGLPAGHRDGVRRTGQPSRPLRRALLLRHYLGRIFATAASLALGIGFYDTQCGAKLFRATPEIMSLFQSPFATRWLFDVEIIARLVATRRRTSRPRVEEIVYEYPLHEWRDVAGSKVKPHDFVKAFVELAAITRNYRWTTRPLRKLAPEPMARGLCASATPAQAPIFGDKLTARLS